MNWYKKAQINKTAFRNIIDPAANEIARKVLFTVMKLYKENRLFIQDHRESSLNMQYEGFEDPIKTTVNIDLLNQPSTRPFIVEAKYTSRLPNTFMIIKNPLAKSTEKTMDIYITFAQNFSDQFFNDFYKDTVMVIRHELNHMEQDQERMFLKYPMDYDPEKLKEPDPIKRFPEI